ncbi:MAG: M20 family metallopeptidase [Armatimonadota bacterium]|nr:M20 family metallopeptidase [Armatimonadota bacterium]MDR7460044.1 M20 family metallopeptidase [Armatimonadota bacterium]MDR7480859.1 M20 family metallopeptidase [Armatimonadota bacterium]MDR7489290.1 M20 family metallopeptidase [Armatimonadota bacterium]MDR7492401.1 M20 family metallopeptidase [Armatimonadota bacterium]
MTTPPTPDPVEPLRREVLAAVDEAAGELWALALDIHAHPEVAFQEHHAAEVLTAALARHGFRITRPVADLATAFRAEVGGDRPGPTVAFLAEYDALPEIGHACGHNLICTMALGAGIGLRRVADRLPGRVLVLGTPAEEGGGGKVLMLQRGAFAGVDAALMVHPAGVTLPARGSLASNRLKVRYLGRAAHAASAPFEGVNALDALILLFAAVGLLRQQLRDDARIHGIITYGGSAVNVIPDRAEAVFSVRAADGEYAQEAMAKVVNCAQAAAQATGATLEYEIVPGYAAIRPNRPLAEAFARHLEALGWPIDPAPERPRMGSTDMGNVSVALPAIHPYIAIGPAELKGHTVEFQEAAVSPKAREALVAAAKAMALVGLDLLTDPAFLEAVRADFAAGALPGMAAGGASP